MRNITKEEWFELDSTKIGDNWALDEKVYELVYEGAWIED